MSYTAGIDTRCIKTKKIICIMKNFVSVKVQTPFCKDLDNVECAVVWSFQWNSTQYFIIASNRESLIKNFYDWIGGKTHMLCYRESQEIENNLYLTRPVVYGSVYGPDAIINRFNLVCEVKNESTSAK